MLKWLVQKYVDQSLIKFTSRLINKFTSRSELEI